jgi:predicted lipoprotein
MTPAARRLPVAVLAWGLSCCVPWTVRPIEPAGPASSDKAAAMSPAAYAESIWESKLIPAILSGAVDARVLLDALARSPGEARTRHGRCEASGGCYFSVKGEGLVIATDRRSRVGLALIDMAPLDGRADVSIQIGPVLRGTSTRDATGIVQFTDFVNQLQFADAGNELNDRILKLVLGPLLGQPLERRTVRFVGTLAAGEKTEPPLRELAPVRLTVEDRGR